MLKTRKKNQNIFQKNFYDAKNDMKKICTKKKYEKKTENNENVKKI